MNYLAKKIDSSVKSVKTDVLVKAKYCVFTLSADERIREVVSLIRTIGGLDL